MKGGIKKTKNKKKPSKEATKKIAKKNPKKITNKKGDLTKKRNIIKIINYGKKTAKQQNPPPVFINEGSRPPTQREDVLRVVETPDKVFKKEPAYTPSENVQITPKNETFPKKETLTTNEDQNKKDLIKKSKWEVFIERTTEKEKRNIAIMGIVLIMAIVLVGWIYGLTNSFKKLNLEYNKNKKQNLSPAQWQDMSQQLKENLKEIKTGMEEVKKFNAKENASNSAAITTSTERIIFTEEQLSTSTNVNESIKKLFPAAEIKTEVSAATSTDGGEIKPQN